MSRKPARRIVTGAEFRAARRELGLTQKQIMAMAHVRSKDTVIGWEQSEALPPLVSCFMERLLTGWRP